MLRLSKKHLAIVAAVAYVAATFPGVSSVLLPNQQRYIVFYSIPVFRLGEFVLGMVAGQMFLQYGDIPNCGAVLVVALVALISYLSFGPNFDFNFMVDNVITVPLILALVWGAAGLKHGLLNVILTSKSIVYLGHISYSFYSFQILVILVAINLSSGSKYPFGTYNNWIFTLVLFAILVFVSALSFHWIEVALRKTMLKRFSADNKEE